MQVIEDVDGLDVTVRQVGDGSRPGGVMVTIGLAPGIDEGVANLTPAAARALAEALTDAAHEADLKALDFQ